MMGALFFALKTFVFENVFHVTLRNWLATLCLVPGTIIAVIAQFILIPRYGMIGAATSFVLGGVVGLLATMAVSRKLIASDIPWNDVLRVVVCALITWLVASLAGHFGSTFGRAPAVILGCLAGGLTYLVSTSLLDLQRATLMEPAASYR
jgi:O-antigen/teichoic acid export membrane protein